MGTWLIALGISTVPGNSNASLLVSSPFAAGVNYAVTGWLLGFTLSFAATSDRHVCLMREELG